MTMTRDEAVEKAQAAAAAASGVNVFTDIRLTRESLAAFCGRHSDAPSEALYLHAMSEARGSFQPWLQALPETRVAFDVFRTTYLALEKIIKADELVAMEAARATIGRKMGVGHMYKSALRKQKRMADRVSFAPKAKPSPAQPALDKKSSPRETLSIAPRQATAKASSIEPARLAQSAKSAPAKSTGKARR